MASVRRWHSGWQTRWRDPAGRQRTKSFIYRRTARGHGDPIPHYRIGSHLRFKPDDIREWIEGHRHEPEAQSPAALVAALRQNASRSTSSQKPVRRRGRTT